MNISSSSYPVSLTKANVPRSKKQTYNTHHLPVAHFGEKQEQAENQKTPIHKILSKILSKILKIEKQISQVEEQIGKINPGE